MVANLWKDVGKRSWADAFTFTAVTPTCQLTFPSFMAVSPPLDTTRPPKNLKRGRPLSDVDGETPEAGSKKKRRLRLFLITSRLSLPFSAPPTHIVDRGPSKIAVWAKQKALGRNLLRKTAIMNQVRKMQVAAREVQQRQMEIARQEFLRHQSCIAQIPRRAYLPLPPSPLGLSNYDALDLEDEAYTDENADGAEGPLIYSDFNILEPEESALDDYDGLPQDRRPPTPPDEREIESAREQMRQRELSFLSFS
jgi:hypothetical protein